MRCQISFPRVGAQAGRGALSVTLEIGMFPRFLLKLVGLPSFLP